MSLPSNQSLSALSVKASTRTHRSCSCLSFDGTISQPISKPNSESCSLWAFYDHFCNGSQNLFANVSKSLRALGFSYVNQQVVSLIFDGWRSSNSNSGTTGPKVFYFHFRLLKADKMCHYCWVFSGISNSDASQAGSKAGLPRTGTLKAMGGIKWVQCFSDLAQILVNRSTCCISLILWWEWRLRCYVIT